MLASKARAASLLLRASGAHLRHLLQLQRGALRAAQHHLRQHRQDEPLPLPPRLHLHRHHRLLLFVFLIGPHHLHVPAHPIPPLLPRGEGMLHLREGWMAGGKKRLRNWENERRGKKSSEVMKNYCMYLPNTGHCMLRKNTVFCSFDCSLNVHRSLTFDLLKHPQTTGSSTNYRSHYIDPSDLSSTPGTMRSAFLCPRQDDDKTRKLLLEDSQWTKSLSQKHKTIRQTPTKSDWLLCPHRERIDFMFLLSPGWHVLRYADVAWTYFHRL